MLLLRLLCRPFGFFFFSVVVTGAIWILFFFAAVFSCIVLIIVDLIGVLAQLIAVTQILDHFAREFGKISLIVQDCIKVF